MTDFETIVVALVEANKKWPELRFTQVLQVLEINLIELADTPEHGHLITDNFYTDDKTVLKDIEQALKELQNETILQHTRHSNPDPYD